MGKDQGHVSADAAAHQGEPKPAENADSIAVLEPAARLAAVVAERDQLVAEKAELQDRLLRRLAEFENFRRRAEREKSEVRDNATMEVIRHVLPVLDDFERALALETTDKEHAKGMELIYQRLAAELQKLGLEPMSTYGQKFDPHIHHALETQPVAGVEEHTILAEFQKGYTFRGRLLRPALVKVAAASPAEKQAEK